MFAQLYDSSRLSVVTQTYVYCYSDFHVLLLRLQCIVTQNSVYCYSDFCVLLLRLLCIVTQTSAYCYSDFCVLLLRLLCINILLLRLLCITVQSYDHDRQVTSGLVTPGCVVACSEPRCSPTRPTNKKSPLLFYQTFQSVNKANVKFAQKAPFFSNKVVPCQDPVAIQVNKAVFLLLLQSLFYCLCYLNQFRRVADTVTDACLRGKICCDSFFAKITKFNYLSLIPTQIC